MLFASTMTVLYSHFTFIVAYFLDVIACSAATSSAMTTVVEKEEIFAIGKAGNFWFFAKKLTKKYIGAESNKSSLYFVNEVHSSSGVPNLVMNMEEVKKAAMEDSLVKGTCQQFRKIIRSWEVVRVGLRSSFNTNIEKSSTAKGAGHREASFPF